ncbi:TonB-dependent receptor [Rhizosaccharibacter radicis]|uniref:TonB-dependent receptor n=1 Tax=Rhizosaccharibacter radicis TaxID=2782605 RepID=A0ABT1VZ06_9PROT|nr:TonB-dependent receptor [Acetobacteraceae bacterium KSS12]
MALSRSGRPYPAAPFLPASLLCCALATTARAAPAGVAGGAEDITVSGHAGFPSVNGSVGSQPGGGLIRPQDATLSTSEVGADFIARQAPTANAFGLVAALPGANVAQADPLGLSASNSLSLRGLGSDEIGFLLEGMPLNDAAYFTGYPNQFSDSENLDHISLQQGSAGLDAPLVNAAGGLLSLGFRDPGRDFGGVVEGSYGSYHTNREFVRLDTGELGHSGIRGFVSYSHTAADNWRGSGRDKRQHVDLKFQRDWDNGDHAGLVATWNDTVTSAYEQPTLADWKAYGRSNNYAGSFDGGDTSYWRLFQQPYRLFYATAPLRLTLAQGLVLTASPYAQYGYGAGLGGTTLPETGLFQGTEPIAGSVANPNGQGVATATYKQATYRAGLAPKLSWTLGDHTLFAGYWYDYVDDREPAPFGIVSDDGTPTDIWSNSARSTLLLPDGRQLLAQDAHMIAQTNAIFLGDTMSLWNKRVTLELGFKDALSTRTGWNAIPGARYRTGINSAEPLPHLGARWQIDRRNQLFMSVGTNFRVPAETVLFDSFDPASGTQTGAANTGLRDEYSISEELGYRYSGDLLIGSVTLFNYNFTNRQVATIADINGALVSSTLNAGGQSSRGVDAEIGLRPWHHLSPYLSGEYLHATIDNDIAVGGDLLPTAGHTAVRSPTWQGAAGLSYDDGRFFGVVTVKYTGAQYATFTNDERIADHTQADLSLGVRLPSVGRAQHPELRLNLVNVTDEQVLSGVATPTPNARDTVGRYGTMIAGSAPTYYVGGGFAALLTGTVGF